MRLADQRSGTYCWAARVGAAGDALAAVDRIASIVDGQVELAEIAASRRVRPDGESAPDLYRRAQFYARKALPDSHALGAGLLQRALAIEPDNVRYLALLCDVAGPAVSMGWPKVAGAEARRLLFDMASHGLRQPTADAEAMCAFGFGIYHGGDPDWGYAMIQRAAELNPNSLSVACLAGNTALHWGSIEDAERHLRRGTGLDPSHPTQGNILGGLARISMIKGQFEAALVSARRAHAASPNYGAVRWTLIAANAHLGRREIAKGLLGSFNADHPEVTVQSIRAGQPNGGRMSSTLEGLDYAGLARG